MVALLALAGCTPVDPPDFDIRAGVEGGGLLPPGEYIIENDDNGEWSGPDGMGRSKMGTDYFERRLGVVPTTRNWRTVHKLIDMAGG